MKAFLNQIGYINQHTDEQSKAFLKKVVNQKNNKVIRK